MTTLNVAQAVEKCVDEVYGNYAALTARSYAYGLKRFVEFLARKGIPAQSDLSLLTMEHFIAFPAWLSKQGYSKSSAIARNSAAKAFLDWMVINNVLQPTYAEALRHQKACASLGKKREEKLPKTVPPGSVEAIQRMIYQMDDPSPIRERNIAIVELLISSGCRIAEACSLKVKHLNLDEREGMVDGKGSKQRVIFFSPETSAAILSYWQVRGFADKKHPAFARHDDGASKGKKMLHLSTLGAWEAIKKIANLAGFPDFHPHLFRHNFANRLLDETNNLAQVQDLLGHSSPVSTRQYTKTNRKDLKQVHSQVWHKEAQ